MQLGRPWYARSGNAMVAAGIYHNYDYPFYYWDNQGERREQGRSLSEQEVGAKRCVLPVPRPF